MYLYYFSGAFVDNIFQQVNGNEISYSCNQVVSRVIENLLPSASEETLTKFMNIFNENIRKMCMDQFGSFIVQKLITIVSNRCLVRIAKYWKRLHRIRLFKNAFQLTLFKK